MPLLHVHYYGKINSNVAGGHNRLIICSQCLLFAMTAPGKSYKKQ